MAYRREVAWRVFAQEYNDSDLEMKGEGDRAPSYVVTPLGAKVNRLFVVGVLTRAEPVAPDSDMWRGQVSDPTGVFHIYAGQYQPEAAAKLQELEPPCFVAVVGKSRAYRPEDGRVLVSLTPEVIREVDHDTRDEWVLETAKLTRMRLDAVDEARSGDDKDARGLARDGFPNQLAEGVFDALPHYGEDRIEDYHRMVKASLDYLVSGSSSFAAADQPAAPEPGFSSGSQVEEVDPDTEEIVAEDDEDDEDDLEAEETAFRLIKEFEDDKGAPWEDILAQMEDEGYSETEVEEALNRLMDKGRIYEPILGRLKPS